MVVPDGFQHDRLLLEFDRRYDAAPCPNRLDHERKMTSSGFGPTTHSPQQRNVRE